MLLVKIFSEILVIEKTPNEYENCYLRTFMRNKNKKNFFEDLTLLSQYLSVLYSEPEHRRLEDLPRHHLVLADELCGLYFGIITDDAVKDETETDKLNAMEYFIMLDVSCEIKEVLEQ